MLEALGIQTPDPALSWLIFAAMVGGALALSNTPLGWPLKWAETFYHEVSHGIACLMTFGRVERMELNLDGSGCCTTRGGWRLPILLAGYAGAALWGGMLYMGGWLLGAEGVTLWLKLELALMVWVFVFWARDVVTWLIIGCMMALYAAAIWLPDKGALPLILQFVGIYVLLNAIRAPLFLVDGRHVGDGAMLADMFVVIPEIVWVALWFIFALGVLGLCMVLTLPMPGLS